MLELARTVRLCIGGGTPGRRHNNFSAWPAMRGLGRFYQLHVRCRGEADPVTGYFLNIKVIDRAVREHVLPYLESLIGDDAKAADTAMGEMMRQIALRLQTPLDQAVRQARFDLTPFYSLTIGTDDMDHVIIRQQYEFAAAHRLHVDALSASENREVFGKCNNPSGHGHNYRVEVAVRAPIDPGGRVLAVEELDAIVDEHVIEKLDHKHLNIDVEQFKSLNPSVENIAKVIYGMLDGVIAGKAGLHEVSVWETSKTVCTYRGVSGTSANALSQ
jgi:6-pyruvoyltetrahydropterin/6-carboxytetrahydropterin synthase